MKKEGKKTGHALKIKPLGDRVLVKAVSDNDQHQKTASGIYIPDTVNKDKGCKEGTVVAVGEGRLEDGKRIPVAVSIGAKILYQWGDAITIGNEEYVVVSESNIIGIIK